MDLEKLRSLVRDALGKHLYATAVFFADKLVTLSGGKAMDVYLLAQSFFLSGQFRRALHLLRTNNLLFAERRFQYLAAKCLEEIQDWTDCLLVLGGMEMKPEDILPLQGELADVDESREINISSAICLLRGKAIEAMGNRKEATLWYRAALRSDAFCFEALDRLLQNHMLTVEEESSLLASLKLDPDDEWLRLLYQCSGKKYGQEDSILQQLTSLAGDLSLLPSSDAAAMRTRENEQQQKQQQQGRGLRSEEGRGEAARAAAEPFPSPFTPKQPQFQTPPQPSANFPGSFSGSFPSQLWRGREGGVEREAKGKEVLPGGGAAAVVATAGAAPTTAVVRGAPAVGSEARRLGSLKANGDVAAFNAELKYHMGDFEAAYAISKRLLEEDPYHQGCIPIHLAAALELGRKNELFLRAHQLVEEYPKSAISWFAVGCYYLCIRQFDQARRYFCKSTVLDPQFGAAWLAFGHAYAAQDESDQAMAAYRTAARFFTGCHLPILCIAMEYERSSNYTLALHFLLEAKSICPMDPLVHNELGIVAYANLDYDAAEEYFLEALRLVPGKMGDAWEPTMVNLGHTYRKLRKFPEALFWYEKARAIRPRAAGTLSALGFTHHLQGNLDEAIDIYHKALGLKPDDSLAAEMLTQALHEQCSKYASSMERHSLTPELAR